MAEMVLWRARKRSWLAPLALVWDKDSKQQTSQEARSCNIGYALLQRECEPGGLLPSGIDLESHSAPPEGFTNQAPLVSVVITLVEIFTNMGMQQLSLPQTCRASSIKIATWHSDG